MRVERGGLRKTDFTRLLGLRRFFGVLIGLSSLHRPLEGVYKASESVGTPGVLGLCGLGVSSIQQWLLYDLMEEGCVSFDRGRLCVSLKRISPSFV